MGLTEIFFSANLKYLRERKRLSQRQLAEQLYVTASRIHALEREQIKAPRPEDYIRISEFFKVSIDNLLKVDLSQLGESILQKLEVGSDAYNEAEHAHPLFPYSTLNLSLDGTYRVFSIPQDDMLPIPEGSDVTCTLVRDWSSIKAGTPCMVLLKGALDFVFKQLSIQNNAIQLSSFNTASQIDVVSVDEVGEIWQFYSFSSRKLPPHLTQVYKLIRELKMEIHLTKSRRDSEG